MAGIKNINVISGTGNPVQMKDLQNLWSAINSLLRSTKTPISIVAGFATANNNTGTNIGEGIICYQGQAYYLAADVAKIGQYLYANTIQDEQRVYEDGTTRYTYQDYVVNAADNASASGIGTLIGQATATNLASWKVGVLSDGSITAAMLADGAVTTPKLANSAVTAAKIANGAVGSLQIADVSITADKIEAETITNEEIANKTIIANQKLENYSIEEAQYGTASVSARALQVNSVTTSIIKNGAITGSKIANVSITADKMAAPGVLYLEPTTVNPNMVLVNHKLNVLRIGNIGSTHVNIAMPVQQLPGTPVRVFIEHTFPEKAVVDIRLPNVGVVAGNINIPSNVGEMYVEIFVYDGYVSYWVSGDSNSKRE